MTEKLKTDVYDSLAESFRLLDEVNQTYEHSFTLCRSTRRAFFSLSLLSFGLALTFSFLPASLRGMIPVIMICGLAFGLKLYFLHTQQKQLLSCMTRIRKHALHLMVSAGFSLNQFSMSDSCYNFCIDRLGTSMKED